MPGAWARPFQRLFSRGASLTVAFVAAALLAACGGGSSDSVSSAGGDLSPRMAQIAGTVEVAKSVEMKVLVISATGTAPSYLAITSILDQIGVPYDKMVLKGTNATALQMVAGKLSDGAGNGKYQGIILETGDLPYEETTNCAALGFGSPCYPSALTADQWKMLRQYQFDFGVRSATMYTRASLTPDSATGVQLNLTYGLDPVSGRTTNDYTTPPDLPVTANLTPTNGVSVFSYLNPANPVIVKNAYTYLSTAVAGTQTVPLLTATEGGTTYAIASVYTAPAGAATLGVAPGGWENLAITADSNPELTHTLLLGYGVVNWVTKGVFLGERKIYMTAQPDDVLIPDELWDPATNTTPGGNLRYRNTGTDYDSLAAWQTAFHSAHPNLAAFRLEIPFNGVGYNTTDTNILNPGELTDSLSPRVRANPNAFRWINHTWDHTSLDPEGGFTPTVASIVSQLTQNHLVATGALANGGLPVTFANYVKSAFIQPDISGLENPVFWEAAQNFGLRYILMDTSKAYANFVPARPVVGPIVPNTGYYSSLDTFVPANPRIFIIPRYPTNLFYNNSTPTEWVSEYNFLYASKPPSEGGIGFVSTYEQILDREAAVLVRYMLKFNVNSWMFHAANLRDYDGAGGLNKSTLSDLLDAVAQQYSAMYNLQVLSPSQAEIGEIMKARMAYNAAIAGGVKGRIVFGPSVTIQVTNPTGVAVTVPLTGAVSGGVAYGGQQIAPLAVVAGGTTTVAAPAIWTPAQADMSVTIVPSTSAPLQGGTLTYSVVIKNLGPNSVTGASFSNTLQAGLGTITNVVTQVSAGATTPTFATTPTSLSGLVSMPAGGQITVTYQASVSPTATGTLTSTASVTEPADRNDPNLLNNTATNSVNVGLADVSTSVTLPTTAIAGSVVTGTVTFSNASVVTGGTAVAATAVTGTVTLSNGTVQSFAIGTLAPGASSVKSFTTTVPSTVGTTALSATSTVATTSLESNTTDNTGVASLAVLFADPGVLVNPIPTGNPGETVTANVTLSNSGAVAVTFTPEVIINGVSSLLPPVTLAPGASSSQAVAVLVTPIGAKVTANVTAASIPDSNPANNSSTATLTFPGGGGGGCTTNPDGKFDPLLWMMLLAGGVATGLRRRRTADLVNDRH